MPALTLIAFDADDTLWQNLGQFHLTQDRITALLSEFAGPDHFGERLLAAERRNLGHYGYGVKGFMLSLIETAIEVTEGQVSARVIAEILSAGRAMLEEPVQLMPHASATLAALARSYQVIVITKGDLLDQERKIAQSGLGDLLHGAEIVSDKTAAVYSAIFTRYGHRPETCMMVGNSLRSDVLPALAAGAFGVHVPAPRTWEMERADAPQYAPRYHAIEDLGALQDLIDLITDHNH